MLKEQTPVRQVPGEPRRRWFVSPQFDLILWLRDDGGFAGFELCYDRRTREHAIIWRPDSGFVHMAVDDGENRPGKHKATPVLVANGPFDAGRIRDAFAREAVDLPGDVSEYVLRALATWPSGYS